MARFLVHNVYQAAVTDDVLLTPTTGKALHITDIIVSSKVDSVGTTITLKFDSSVFCVFFMSPQGTSLSINLNDIIMGNLNEQLLISSSEDVEIAVSVLGYQS